MASLHEVRERVETFKASVDILEDLAKLLGNEGDNHGVRRKLQNERSTCEKLKGVISVELRTMKLAARAMPDGGAEYRTLSKTWDEHHRKYAKLRVETLKKEEKPPPLGKPSTAHFTDLEAGPEEEEEPDHMALDFNQQEPQFKAYNMTALATEEAIAKERCEDLKNVEQRLNELDSCYHELSDIVHEQSEPLKEALTGLESGIENVKKGTTDLQKASKHQKSSRKKMCCLIVLILIIVVIVVVVATVAA
eukprot:TRINITY_DN13826_c3_g1_i1.p1 TRINITY_DN13826_c3_g1~~TRINITY_DN13826_c3_g1_i1.p1  ORF type:complete len:269 (+),score=71.82 TRINITY_DN13826_c3_g1_i1:60-809(+)